MGYVGLIPSEQTSGVTRRRGPITKTGNAHVRHLLVESAWHYRNKPRMSKALRERSVGVSPEVLRSRGRRRSVCTTEKRLIGRGNAPARR